MVYACVTERERQRGCVSLNSTHTNTHTSVDLHSIVLPLHTCVRQREALLCPPFEPDLIQMTGFSQGRSNEARGLHGSAVIHRRAQGAES